MTLGGVSAAGLDSGNQVSGFTLRRDYRTRPGRLEEFAGKVHAIAGGKPVPIVALRGSHVSRRTLTPTAPRHRVSLAVSAGVATAAFYLAWDCVESESAAHAAGVR